MREKTDDIRDLFVKNDSGVIIDVSRKQGTLECVSVQKFEQENRVSTRWQIIKGQIRHMDKNILWMHLAVCAGIVVLVWTNWFDVQSWEKIWDDFFRSAWGIIFFGSWQYVFFKNDGVGGSQLL